MIILSCTKVIEDDAANKQRVVEERTPIFIDLEYLMPSRKRVLCRSYYIYI
jgi:hypothetical protein